MHHRSCVPPRVILLVCSFAEYIYARLRPLHPLHRLGITLQFVCFLSFAHVVRSSIRALTDERPAVTPMRIIRPVSTVALGCLARAYFLSLTGVLPVT